MSSTQSAPEPAAPPSCRLFEGDALYLGRHVAPASVDLVYVDPPFGSGLRRQGRGDLAYPDQRRGGPEAFTGWLMERLAPTRAWLKPGGSLYVHLDWRSVHYVKVALDRCFGVECFLNEIVWLYGLGGSSPRRWPRKHDTLLWYAREAGRQWFQAPRIPARSQRLKGQDKKAPSWWDIPALNNMARERVGWPTQKPEALLERIALSSCPPGGLVVDLFAGSGTTAVAAVRHGRHALLCDLNPRALDVACQRLAELGAQTQRASI